MVKEVTFNGNRYDVAKVIVAASSAPKIQLVKGADPIVNDKSSWNGLETGNEPITVTKFENEYVLLTGRVAFRNAQDGQTLDVYLLSRPALKRAKIVFIPKHEQAVPSVLRRQRSYPYNDRYEN